MKIAVCTVGSPCLPVFKASLDAYAREHELVLSGPGGLPNTAKNFGGAYNDLLYKIFETESECLVSNDDIVINPNTVSHLLEDVTTLKATGQRIGWVGARSDYVLPAQNIRFAVADDRFINLRFESESRVKEASVIAPIFAWISKEAFLAAPFAPINWYSDNVSCDDMSKLGYRHFVSRAYVHHVGGTSTGSDFNKLTADAAKWMWENRPGYAQKYNLSRE